MLDLGACTPSIKFGFLILHSLCGCLHQIDFDIFLGSKVKGLSIFGIITFLPHYISPIVFQLTTCLNFTPYFMPYITSYSIISISKCSYMLDFSLQDHIYNMHKIEFRSQEYVYLWVLSHHKGCKCLRKTCKVFIYKDVVFHVRQFSFPTLFQYDHKTSSQTRDLSKSMTFPPLSTHTYPNEIVTNLLNNTLDHQVVQDRLPSS